MKRIDDRWLSVDEIARYLEVSRESIYPLISAKGLPKYCIGRFWKFKCVEVDEWVLSGKAADEPTPQDRTTTMESGNHMAMKSAGKEGPVNVRHFSHEVACVDLFCGVGGLTHGLIAAGVPVTAGVDLDGACRHPYEANNPGATFFKHDVARLTATEVESWFGAASIRVLAGCAPCQPFSTYAQRYETKGTERWGLLNHFARLVRQLAPDIVTMENVPTVTRHEVFDDFVATLKRQGYKVWYNVVDSAEYGLPQRRRRTVLLASLAGPIRLRDPGSLAPKTVRDVLEGLPAIGHGGSHNEDPLHTASELSPLNLERIKASRPGGSWREWPKQLVAECHRRETGRSYPGVYGRMVWDEPAPTLTTQFYGYGSGRFGHPEQHRALSLREGAILQGFPRTYSFVPNGEQIQFKVLGRLIGNAVPVELGRVIGESILDHVEHSIPSLSIPRREQNGSRTRSSNAFLD